MNRILRYIWRRRWTQADFERFIEQAVESELSKKQTKAERQRRELQTLYSLMSAIEKQIGNISAELLKTGDENHGRPPHH